MACVYPHSEGFSGNDFTAVAHGFHPQPSHKRQGCLDFFPLSFRAARERKERLRIIARWIRLGHFMQLPAGFHQRACRRFKVQAQSFVARLRQGGIHRSHQRIHAHVPLFVILVQRTERLSEHCRIQLLAALAL